MRLGVSSHTYAWGVGVAGFPQPARPLDAFDLVRKAALLHVPVLQLADNLPLHSMTESARRDLKTCAAESRVDLEVGTSGIDRDHLLTYLAIARELSSPLLRTLLDHNGQKPTIREAISRLREVIGEFEAAGVCLAVENHDRFPAKDLATIISAVASPKIGVCLDTANSLGCGEDVYRVLGELAPRVVNLHIKDFQATRLPHHKGFVIEGAPAGRGRLDVPVVLAALRGRHPPMTAIVELWLSPDADIEQTIEREDRWATESVAYVRQCLAASERTSP